MTVRSTVKAIDELAPQLANCRAYWLGWGTAGRGDDDLAHYRSGGAGGHGPRDLRRVGARLRPLLRGGPGTGGRRRTDRGGRGEDPRAVRFVARAGGRAVGTALLFDAHGVTGVYIVATAEAYRRRGIGAALTAAALAEGRRRGLRVGTLQAGGLGAPVYAGMGFAKVAEYELFRPPTSWN